MSGGSVLAGKTALVTGASRGIGRAVAEAMAAAGARVIVSSRDQAACEAVAAEIGPAAVAIAADMASAADIDRLCAAATEACGPVHIVVLNAATVAHFGPMAGMDDAAFDAMVTTNVKSALRICRHLVPPMAVRGDGAIVVIGSTSGLIGEAKLGGYALTKAADMQLVRNLAVEYGPRGVRANAIAPGLVRTDMTKPIWSRPDRLDAVLKTTALRRIAEPEDIAALAVFLASPASRIITGQTIVADAGMTINLSTP